MTTKGQVLKLYQTPYGEVAVPRHVYQTSAGGAIFCPLDNDARIILTSTPRFASQVSYKMSEMSAPATQKDLSLNQNRDVSHRVLQRLAEAVANVVQIKEETWSYTVLNIDDAEIKMIRNVTIITSCFRIKLWHDISTNLTSKNAQCAATTPVLFRSNIR